MYTASREGTVCALLVGSFDTDRLLVHEIFKNAGWRLFEAANRQRALRTLHGNRVHVVIVERDLADWNWKDVLRDLRRNEQPPQLIVASRTADDCLWAEALNLGAFDVLRRPFDRDEVERVVASAHRHYQPVARNASWALRPATGAA